MKRIFAVWLSVFVLLAAFAPPCFAAKTDRFSITDPYAGVDWATVGQYKTALHTHTNASDGAPTLKQSLQRHLETGFDIVAVTDHGTVDTGWDAPPADRFIKSALTLLRRSAGDLVCLGESGVFDDGTAYTYGVNEQSDALLQTANGRSLLRLPFGIEQNAVSVNAHVTSWFAPFCDNTISGYEAGLRGVSRAGGLCVLNHPGEYTKARYELHSADAYNEKNIAYAYYINKFAAYLDKYAACIGVDMNSKGDHRTRFDRILWDKLLTRFAARGETVLGVASSDAHQLSVIDTGFCVLLLPEKTAAAAKTALQNGTFFAASHCLGNADELYEIAGALQTFYGAENPVCCAVRESADRMTEKAAAIERGAYDADEDIGITYSTLDADGFCKTGTFPTVKSIAADDRANTICIRSENALLVRFISDGKTVATLPAADAVLDLDDYAGSLGDYVRAEIFGEGGVLYTQAFLLNAEENAADRGDAKVTRGCFFDLGIPDFLLAETHRWLRVCKVFLRSKGIF